MNKLVVVGHPYSDYQRAEEFLYQAGMQSVLPSRREALKPSDINHILMEEYQTKSILDVELNQPFEPVQVNALWQSLSLDLMLGNLNQKLYGWADPNTILFMDYWKAIDSLAFIFVYEHPIEMLRKQIKAHIQQNALENLDSITDRVIYQWKAYHRSILAFYKQNKDRCIVLSLDTIESHVETCKSAISRLISAPFSVDQSEYEQYIQAPHRQQDKNEVLSDNDLPKEAINEFLNIDRFLDYFLEKIMSEDRSILQVYNELQKTAIVASKLDKQKVKAKDILTSFIENRVDLFQKQQQFAASMNQIVNDYKQQHAVYTTKLENYKVLEKQLFVNQEQLELQQFESVQKREQEEQFKKQVAKLKQEKSEAEKLVQQQKVKQAEQLKQAKLEAEKLAKQQVLKQEEKFKQQIQKLKQEQEDAKKLSHSQKTKLEAEIKKSVQQLKSAQQYAEELINQKNVRQTQVSEQQLKELEQVQQTAQKQANELSQQRTFVKKLSQEKSLLFKQVHQLQEKLEQEFLEGQQKQKLVNQDSSNIVKSQLPYRIGSLILQSKGSVNDMLILPSKILHEKSLHTQEEQEPIAKSEKERIELEKVKGHLSYRLGRTVVDHMQSPTALIKLPFAVLQESLVFKKQQRKARK